MGSFGKGVLRRTVDAFKQLMPTYLSVVWKRMSFTMAKERSVTARGVAVLPLLLMGAIHLSVTPLRQIFEIEPLFMYAWYGIAAALGFVLFRKTRTVRDFEYHRSQTMKSMKKVYQAEEAGVWQTNVQLDTNLSPEGKLALQRQVASIDKETPELELHEDEKVEVDLLLESKQVRTANSRVSGNEMFGDGQVHSTIGAKRKASPMDSFLDFVGALFGRGNADERREERRQAALRAASTAAPVTAQRPVAPMRTSSNRDDSELKMTSMSDDGGIDSVMTESGTSLSDSQEFAQPADTTYAWDSSPAPSGQGSIEDMAMMGTSQFATAPIARVAAPPPSGNRCKGCSAVIPPGEPFCLHCGLDA